MTMAWGIEMLLNSQMHIDLMAMFEKEFKHMRLDREGKEMWPKCRIYQDGTTNALFLAYRSGCALGLAMGRDS